MINAYLYPTPSEFQELREQQSKAERQAKQAEARAARYGTQQTTNQIISELFCELFGLPVGAVEIATRQASDKFIWFTHKGDALRLEDMATPHLFYSLRMLFNNTVPPVFRIGEFKRYRDIPSWSDDYKAQAFRELTAELLRRDDLDTDLQDQLDDLIANTKAILALGL